MHSVKVHNNLKNYTSDELVDEAKSLLSQKGLVESDNLVLKYLEIYPEDVQVARFYESGADQRDWKITADNLINCVSKGLDISKIGIDWLLTAYKKAGSETLTKLLARMVEAATNIAPNPKWNLKELYDNTWFLNSKMDSYFAAFIDKVAKENGLTLGEVSNDRKILSLPNEQRRTVLEIIKSHDISGLRAEIEYLYKKSQSKRIFGKVKSLPSNWRFESVMDTNKDLSKALTLQDKLAISNWLIETGQMNRAMSWLRSNLKLSQDNDRIKHELVKILYRLGNYEEAEYLICNIKSKKLKKKCDELRGQYRNYVMRLDESNHLILATMEKSGTHYAQTFISNYLNSYSKYKSSGSLLACQILDIRETSNLVKSRNQYWEDISQYKPCDIDLSGTKFANFVRQHDFEYLDKDDIYICSFYRNPLDFLISAYFYFESDAAKGFSIEDFELKLDKYVNKFLKRYLAIRHLTASQDTGRVFVASYEMLVENPKIVFKAMLNRFGLECDETFFNWLLDISSFKKAKAIGGEPKEGRYALARSGKIGQWKQFLSDDLVKEIGEKLMKYNVSLSEFQLLPSSEGGLDLLKL